MNSRSCETEKWSLQGGLDTELQSGEICAYKSHAQVRHFNRTEVLGH